MADEPKTVVTEPSIQEEKTFSQAEVDRLISQRLEREKSKFSDYEDLKNQVATLTTEKKEREEAEMTELEKQKRLNEEYQAEIEKHKVNTEWRTNWEAQEEESINALMTELDDDTKDIINALPLEKRRAAVAKFNASSNNPPPSTEKGVTGKSADMPTIEDVRVAREKWGAGHPNALKVWEAYQAGSRVYNKF